MTEQQPTTPETQQEKPYVLAAHEVIKKASENAHGTTERFVAVDTYVANFLEAAERGEVTGSRGVYTKEDLFDQIEDFLADSKRPVEAREQKDPSVYIPSIDGMRASFQLLMDNDATSRDFEDSLKMHIEAHHQKRAELLSPENIESMGEAEVRAAEVTDPMVGARRAAGGLIEGIPEKIQSAPDVNVAEFITEPEVVEPQPALTAAEYLKKLTDGLSEDDMSELRQYAEASDEQRQAQQDGRGQDSTYWGQIKGQSFRAMSSNAKTIANQYAHAYNHYT